MPVAIETTGTINTSHQIVLDEDSYTMADGKPF